MIWLRALAADLLLALAAWCRDYVARVDAHYASALDPGEPDD